MQAVLNLVCCKNNFDRKEKCKINSQITAIFQFSISFCAWYLSVWCGCQVKSHFWPTSNHNWNIIIGKSVLIKGIHLNSKKKYSKSKLSLFEQRLLSSQDPSRFFHSLSGSKFYRWYTVVYRHYSQRMTRNYEKLHYHSNCQFCNRPSDSFEMKNLMGLKVNFTLK